MKKHKLFPFLRWRMCHSLLATSLATTLSLAGCTADDNRTAGDSLPEGKYPLTFTATVEGQRITKAGTRATLNNEWEGNEEVAVKVGAIVKKYTVAADGALTLATTSEEPHYWISNPLTVRAWYSPTYSDQQPTSFTVAADQSSDEGYQQGDKLLYTSQQFTFSKTATPQLAFKHLPAKVVINLKAGAGIEATDVESATVTLINQLLTGTMNEDGTMTHASQGMEEIIPHAVSSVADGYQRTLQALVVPQQMQGRKFIKVTCGGNVYYYTPLGAKDADLATGKQHTYNITVKHGLSVTMADNGTQWTEGASSTGEPASPVFRVTLSGSGSLPQLTNLDGITSNGNNVYQTTNGSSFSFSYTVPNGEYKKGFFARRGLTNVARTVASNNNTYTYTFTYTNVRSDLQLEYADYPVQVGDYYYSDGNYLPIYISGSSSACIGIVFKAGADATDKASYYEGKLPDGIHGYVAALKDAYSSITYWGGDNVLIGTSTNQDDYLGYSNTQKILKKAIETGHLQSHNRTEDYPAMFFISVYHNSVPAPANSSGWYFPSTGQLEDIYNARGSIQNNFSQAGGAWFKSTTAGGRYFSSSEYAANKSPASQVGYFSFQNGNKDWAEKDGYPTPGRNLASYVRAILTF